MSNTSTGYGGAGFGAATKTSGGFSSNMTTAGGGYGMTSNATNISSGFGSYLIICGCSDLC